MTRRAIPLDAGGILRALADRGVDYVVIGGLAVQTHGHPRTTQNLDLMPNPDPHNLERLLLALSDLGARPIGQPVPARIELPRQGVLALDTELGGVDIHLDPAGAAPYGDLRARSLDLELELDSPVPVRVAGLDDLIAMKRASGRPIDRGDIVALTTPLDDV